MKNFWLARKEESKVCPHWTTEYDGYNEDCTAWETRGTSIDLSSGSGFAGNFIDFHVSGGSGGGGGYNQAYVGTAQIMSSGAAGGSGQISFTYTIHG